MTYDEIQSALQDVVTNIMAGAEYVKPSALGLDVRVGNVFVGEDFIATTTPRLLDYYGGFEYVDAEYVLHIGDVKVYSNEDSRVADHLSRLELNEDTEE